MTYSDEVLADTPKFYGEFNGNMNDTIIAGTAAADLTVQLRIEE